MQTNQAPARSGRPAVQQGIIFGVIAGIVFAVNSILGNLLNIGAAAGIIGILLFLVELFLYATAGFRASAQTGRVGTGTLAGAFTGLIGGIIGFIVTIIIVFAATDALRQRAQAAVDALHANVHYTNALIISSAFIGAILGLAVAIGLGAAFGAIGGVMGRNRAPRAQAPYQETFYQGMPPSPSNPAQPYNQGYPPRPENPYNQPPQSTVSDPYNQANQGYPPNQQNPYPYNQPPQSNATNPTTPSDPYSDQQYPPTPPSSNAY